MEKQQNQRSVEVPTPRCPHGCMQKCSEEMIFWKTLLVLEIHIAEKLKFCLATWSLQYWTYGWMARSSILIMTTGVYGFPAVKNYNCCQNSGTQQKTALENFENIDFSMR